MDKENLYKLKKIAHNLSILYIEDDKALQSQVGGFLTKLFGTFYSAKDGDEGFDLYLEKKPDIILTSLIIPKRNGFDMVVDIKGENPDAKIIILSQNNDDLELLQTIDMGIVEFLIKPLDINTLLDALLVALSQIQKQEKDKRCIEDLQSIKKQNGTLDFYSSYKGISLFKVGELLEVKDDEFIVRVPKTQFLAIKNSKNTVINIPSLDKCISANVFDIDEQKKQFILINPQYISYKLMKLQQKRININKTFKVGIHLKKIAIEAKVLDISFTSLSFYIEDLDSGIKANDRVELTLGVEIDSVSSMINEKRFAKVFAKGQILKVEPYKNGYKLLSLLKVQKASQRTLGDYLKQREMEIIGEFKNKLMLLK